MSILETIRSRRSVRTFDGNALDPEVSEKLLNYAKSIDDPYGIDIEWKILDGARYGLNSPVINGTETYMAGKLKKVPHAEEAYGYTFEKVVLLAESLGIGTTWIGGTMNRTAFEKAMEVSGDEIMPCVSPLGYPAKKMSLRETMMRKGIRADSRRDFEELFFDGSFDKPLKKEASGKLSDALEAVRLAPSAVNKQPWRLVICKDAVHFYEQSSPGYISKDGWDMQKIDMGIALCHFDAVLAEAGIKCVLEVNDPGIGVPKDTSYIATYMIQA